MKQHNVQRRYVTNVLIIGRKEIHKTIYTHLPGNGPSGLAMSAILSGWRPYFDTNQQHPDKAIDERLRANAHMSIVDQVS
jgi:hypothetical protein